MNEALFTNWLIIGVGLAAGVGIVASIFYLIYLIFRQAIETNRKKQLYDEALANFITEVSETDESDSYRIAAKLKEWQDELMYADHRETAIRRIRYFYIMIMFNGSYTLRPKSGRDLLKKDK